MHMRGRADRGSWQAGLKADFVPLGDRFGHLHSRFCCFFSWEIVDSFAATRLLALLRFRVAVDYTKAGGCEVLRAIRLADSCTTGKDSRVGWDEAGAFFVGSSSLAVLGCCVENRSSWCFVEDCVRSYVCPTSACGSSLRRTVCHQRLMSCEIVPVPTVPRRLSSETFSMRMAGGMGGRS